MRVVGCHIERRELGPAPGRPAPRRARRGLVVSLVDDEGRVGLGEATPLPGFSPDDAGAVERALAGVPAALGPLDLRAAPALSLRRAAAPVSAALRGLPAARFALETALFDLLGQRLGLSVAACLGGARRYARVALNGLLDASDGPDALVARGRAHVARGLRAVKVKLRSPGGDGFARDLDAVRALRRALPAIVELRLDANGAWTEREARARLAQLAPLGLRFVEQPVAPERLHRLGPCDTPWAADESLGLDGMPERLLEAEGCVAFVLKPAALGLLRAHDLARRAQARGLDVVVTHLLDGPVALAAACELALSLPRPPLACGLDPHAGLAAWPPIPVPQLAGAPTHAAPSDRPGLGVAPWTA